MGLEPRHDLATHRVDRNSARWWPKDAVAGLTLGQRDKRGTAAACCLSTVSPLDVCRWRYWRVVRRSTAGHTAVRAARSAPEPWLLAAPVSVQIAP
jgi:hypothetical protein